MPPQLDHIVILVSPEEFEDPPKWLSDNFTILNGGTHAKGTSHNKLILFEDGTYLELFAWVQPPPKGTSPHADFPSWARRNPGEVIDWALTGGDAYEKHKSTLQALGELKSAAEELNLTYDEPREGGRKRLDGKELKWATTRPRLVDESKSGDSRSVPFFCHDVTDREFRVQYTKKSSDDYPTKITHPCGAIGVSGMTVNIPANQFDQHVSLYNSLVGSSGKIEGGDAFYHLSCPGSTESESGAATCLLRLRKADGQSTVGVASMTISSRSGNQSKSFSPHEFGTEINLC